MRLRDLRIQHEDPTIVQTVTVIAANAALRRAFDPARVRAALIEALARWSYGGSTLYEIALQTPEAPTLEIEGVERHEGGRDVVHLATSFRLAYFRAKCTTDTVFGSYADPVLTADAVEVKCVARLLWPDPARQLWTFDLERAGGTARAVNSRVSGNDNLIGDIVWGIVDLFLPDELSTTFDLTGYLQPLVALGNREIVALAAQGVAPLSAARVIGHGADAPGAEVVDLVVDTIPMRAPTAAQLGWWTATERHLVALHDMDSGVTVTSSPLASDATRVAALPMVLAARDALQAHLTAGLAARGFADPDVTVRPHGPITFDVDPGQEPSAVYLRALVRDCALDVSSAGRPDADLAVDLEVYLRVGLPGADAPGGDVVVVACAAAARMGDGHAPEALRAVHAALREPGPLSTAGEPASPLGALLREHAVTFARELLRPVTEALAREPARRPVTTLVLPGHGGFARAAERVFGSAQAQGLAVLAASRRGGGSLRGVVRWDDNVALPLGAPVLPTDEVTMRVAAPRAGPRGRARPRVMELPRAVSLAPQFTLQARRLFPDYFDDDVAHLPEFSQPCGAVEWGQVQRDGERPRAISFTVADAPAGPPLTLQLALGAIPARVATGGRHFLATRVTANWLGDLTAPPSASSAREGIELRISAVPGGYDTVADPQGAAAMIDPRVNPAPASRRPVSVFASRAAKASFAVVAARRRGANPR